ncbi:MAG: helix-turn-helix transcriptional regulator [Chthoniobacterales bacterium]|nr:helix-turn-helix transcriptional regulator [Chthoniobacterales bacterium]
MNAVDFSTRLAAWCAKYPNQSIAAAELGASYGTLTGWLGGRMPCALTRAAVLRRIEYGTMEPVRAVSAAELAAECRMWRGRHGLSQINAAELLGLPRETIRSVEAMGHEPKPLFSDEILHRMGQPVDAEALAEVKRRERPVEPAVLAAALRRWRKRHRMTRDRAADALTKMGFFTTGRTIWVWETARMLPRQPMALMRMLEAKPPKPPRKPKPDKSFGRQLRAWRRGRGLTQVQALAALGVPGDQAKWSDWERGKKIPKNVPELIAKMEAVS